MKIENRLFETLGTPRVLVLGDVMLDRYVWGDVERISPEAPVLVLRAEDQEVRLGGAASVATLLRSLDAEVVLAGVVGNDSEGRLVQRLLDEAGIERRPVVVDPDRPTTTKQRCMGRAANRHPHQMLRIDYETTRPLADDLEAALGEAVRSQLPNCDALLISDYAKGVCTSELLAAVIARANEVNIPVLVDPARGADPDRYRGATCLTPNRIEAGLATGVTITTPEEAIVAGRTLCARFAFPEVLVTLDRDGIARVRSDGTAELFPTRAREVSDITGAGDTVLAVIGICLASGIPVSDAIEMANLAAGLQVERLGVAPIARHELLHPCVERKSTDKMVSLDRLTATVADLRKRGRRLVFTNGCFDLLHVGHCRTLQEAATLGDVLIVAINSDQSVRALKGEGRPIIGEQSRAEMVAALSCVDFVLIFDDDTPHRLLRVLRPDILVKGGTTGSIFGADVVEEYGGVVRRLGAVPGVSTTDLVSTIGRMPCP